MDIDLEKDHLETPPGKDFPKLSTSPGSASAAETKFSRVYDWGHAQSHARCYVKDRGLTILMSKTYSEAPHWVDWDFVGPASNLTFSSFLSYLLLLSFHRYWCLLINIVCPKLCLNVFPWKTQKEGSMRWTWRGQQEVGHVNLCWRFESLF